MRLVIFIVAYLCIASLVCSAVRDSKAIEDRLALKRRIQLQKLGNQLNPVSEAPVVQDTVKSEDVQTTHSEEQLESKVEDHTTQVTPVTSIPEPSSTAPNHSVVNERLAKARSTVKPFSGRPTKPTTEKAPEEEVTTKTLKPIRKPTVGPKFVPNIKPFDPSRRQSVIGNPSRNRPANTVVSIRPFKKVSSARLGAEETVSEAASAARSD